MSALLVQLTSDLTAVLEGLSDSWGGEQFTVRRSYTERDEELHEADGDGAVVDVLMPEEYDDTALETREAVKYTATVEVVLRKRIPRELQDQSGRAASDELDDLVLLAETIGRSATYDRISSVIEAAWLKTAHSPLYDRDHLRDLHQFTSVILLTFEISQSL